MRDELEQQLCTKYPKIFAQRNGSIMETNMCWGFQCDDGWYWLIDQLCAALQWDTDHNKEPQIVASCVKEKFGTLRFYTTNGETDKQYGQISLACGMSGSICELCGSNQKVTRTKGGWIKTLCMDCQRHSK